MFFDAKFEGKADFTESTFKNGAYFAPLPSWEGNFKVEGVTFKGLANFSKATLEEAHFTDANFEDRANFANTTFTTCNGDENSKADFRRATFEGELYFKAAQFHGDTDFYRARFLDAVKFIGREEPGNEGPSAMFAAEGKVSFTRARVEKPELLSFEMLQLRPNWFVGIDSRKVNFTGVEWYGLSNRLKASLNDEITRIRQKGESGSPYALLAQACRRLSTNAEDNREYPLANEFHYWSMDAARKGDWNFVKDKTWRELLKR